MAGRVVAGAAKAIGKRQRRQLAAPLTITEGAADRLNDILSRNKDATGVILGIKTRGCNGLSYTLNYSTKEDEEEGGSLFGIGTKANGKASGYELVESEGVRVFIEPKALFRIVGTEMDYNEDEVSSEFVFHNPNATGACGCGESFSVG